jgi:plastocyanin
VVFNQYSKYQTKINPSGALASGQSFSVRFTDKGTYTYYDGMHPTLKGTVIVE